jgi:hypothetical protein
LKDQIWSAPALAIALLVASCTNPVDKAAKKRIFSPEDPPKVVASASETLPADRMADDARLARRVLQMAADEATERIGPHLYRASMDFEWSGGGHALKLTETHVLVAGAGGVNGDFHGTVENSRGQGLDVVRVKGSVYARNRYGKYRQRSRDRGMAEREREEIYGALKAFHSLFLGRFKLVPRGTTTVNGREGFKYSVSLASPESSQEGAEPVRLPTLAVPKGGTDSSTARRMAFFQRREPRALDGEIVVDAKKSVVLLAKLDGRLAIVGEKNEGGLRLKLNLNVTDIGIEPHVEAPKDFLPDADKPRGIAAALDRFGIPRAERRSADAGTEEEDSEEP